MGFKQFQNRLLDQSCRECQAKPEWDWWFCPAGGIGERAAGVWDWKAAARGMGNELTGDAGATVGGGCRGCDLVCGHQVGIALDSELEDRGCNRVVDSVLRVKVVDEGMDEAGVESVAGGNALEYVHVVSRGEPVLAALGLKEHAHPDGALDAGDVADDRGDLLAAVLGADLAGHLDVGVALLDAMGKGARDAGHAKAGRR